MGLEKKNEFYSEMEKSYEDVPDTGELNEQEKSYLKKLGDQFEHIMKDLSEIVNDPDLTKYDKLYEIATYNDGYGHGWGENPILRGLTVVGTTAFGVVGIGGAGAATLMIAIRKLAQYLCSESSQEDRF